jgi:hypothetical protein
MDTNLVGYLLGNLDADTHRQVEASLRRDPRARAALARVRRQLGPLAALRSPMPPAAPPGLARRTMARLAAHRRLPDAPPLSPAQRMESRGLGIRRPDLLVAALAVVVALACFGPWLLACQRHAHIHNGQHNLAQIWMSLRSQADMQSTPAGLQGTDPTANLLANRSGSPDGPSEGFLAFSSAPACGDRHPLLCAGRDLEEEVLPAYATQNVLFVGGYVHRVHPGALERLSFSPLTFFPAPAEGP